MIILKMLCFVWWGLKIQAVSFEAEISDLYRQLASPSALVTAVIQGLSLLPLVSGELFTLQSELKSGSVIVLGSFLFPKSTYKCPCLYVSFDLFTAVFTGERTCHLPVSHLLLFSLLCICPLTAGRTGDGPEM